MKFLKILSSVFMLFFFFGCEQEAIQKFSIDAEESSSRAVWNYSWDSWIQRNPADNFFYKRLRLESFPDWSDLSNSFYLKDFLVVNYGEVIEGSQKKYKVTVSFPIIKQYWHNDTEDPTFDERFHIYAMNDLSNIKITFAEKSYYNNPMVMSKDNTWIAEYETSLFPLNHNFEIDLLLINIDSNEYGNFQWSLIDNRGNSGYFPAYIGEPVGSGAFYGVTTTGDLLYYKDSGYYFGGGGWSITGRKVGAGWNFKKVVNMGDGVFYALTNTGELLGYKDNGYLLWGGGWSVTAKNVGSGWNFKDIFSGGKGIIYGVTQQGTLLQYVDTNYRSVGGYWSIVARNLGDSFGHYKTIVSGGHGVLYCITQDGKLEYFKLGNLLVGEPTWAYYKKVIGNGWAGFQEIISGGEGIIYAITQDGRMLYYRDGLFEYGGGGWRITAKEIGSGWSFKQVF